MGLKYVKTQYLMRFSRRPTKIVAHQDVTSPTVFSVIRVCIYNTSLRRVWFLRSQNPNFSQQSVGVPARERGKMKTILSSETMDIPDGVEIKVKAKIIEVKGPRGTLTRNFKHLNLDFLLITDEETGKRKLKVDAWFGSRKTTAAIRTALSHVNNLIIGVTQGFRYKMRFVYAHFPINASITNSNTAIEIRNFLGEKKVRKVDMLDGVTVVRSEKVKDELVLDGNDIELVSRSCALINQKCHVKNKDIRKFLDGIYVSDKAKIEEGDN